jgi:exosome complex component RRP42
MGVKGVINMLIQDQYILNLASNGKRGDGRKLDEYREIKIESNPIYKAEGSARVRLGETEVIAGVKMSVGTPFSDKPNEGVLMVGAEFSPLASPKFETGPPREDAIELARVVDRGIRESGAIDTEKLCIEKGEKVWIVNLDIHILNHAGNLIDASGTAALQALLNSKMPEYDKKTDTTDYEKKTKKLPVKFMPLPITFAKIGNTMVIDPDSDEESVMGTRLVVTLNESGNVCALQKSGSEALIMEDIETSIGLAEKKSKELRKNIK